MKISDEAVEAVAAVVQRMTMLLEPHTEAATARQLLEVAAPYMIAEAWAEAYSAGFGDAKAGNGYDAVGTNPYRTTL